mgnify:CR=1 FL=1
MHYTNTTDFSVENAKVDVHAFLFDDMLLLTRFRKKEQTKAKVRCDIIV